MSKLPFTISQNHHAIPKHFRTALWSTSPFDQCSPSPPTHSTSSYTPTPSKTAGHLPIFPPQPRNITSLNSATSHLKHNYTWQPRARREKQWAAIVCCSCPRRRSVREKEGENRVWTSVCIFQLQTTALQHSSLQHHPSCNHCNQNLCEPRAERENRKFFRFLVSELQSEVTSELD